MQLLALLSSPVLCDLMSFQLLSYILGLVVLRLEMDIFSDGFDGQGQADGQGGNFGFGKFAH